MHQKKIADFEEVVKFINEPLEVNEYWYLLDKKWYDMCKAYHETGDETNYPGPIDNTRLFEPVTSPNSKPSNGTSSLATTSPILALKSPKDGQDAENDKNSLLFKTPTSCDIDSRPLRKDLNEAEGHFIVVPEKCWKVLKNTFGLTSQSHTIRRQVIEPTPGNRIVEIQPITLMLCLYGGKEPTVEKSFSRMTTLNELRNHMRQIFDISADQEVKLWLNNTVHTFKPEVLSPSKSENNIKSSASSSTNAAAATTPAKQPSSNQLTSNSSTNISTPTVITRQAANSMNKLNYSQPPDSSALDEVSVLSSFGQTSSNNNTNQQQQQSSPKMTLVDSGVGESAVVTLEVINADGTWPSSRPRYGTVSTRSSKAQPGLCGLSNMGNTCFMNSALQCLSNTPDITNYILADTYLTDINTNNPLGMHGEIARTYADLIKILWSGNHSSFLPREFKCAVSRFAPQFNGFAQQDCQELMAFLLDGLHEDLNRIRKKPYIELKNDIETRSDEVVAEESWSNYKKRNDSIVVDTFHAMLKSTLVCPGCKLVSVTFDPFCYLSLPLPAKREKQVNVVFIPAPSPVSDEKLEEISSFLRSEELKAIKQYGGSISSFSSTVEEHGLYINSKNQPRGCKMHVPRSGPASEICDIVARTINEERGLQPTATTVVDNMVKATNLVVAELTSEGRLSKVYESNEHYNQINDDIVVIEKSSKYLIPLYIREKKTKQQTSGVVIGKPLFLHVPDLKFETLFKSCLASMSNLTSDFHEELQAESKACAEWFDIALKDHVIDQSEDDSREQQMDCEEEGSKSNNLCRSDGDEEVNIQLDASNENQPAGESDKMDISNDSKQLSNGSLKMRESPFSLCIVNAFGGHLIETLSPNSKECEYSSKLYLGATFISTNLCLPQFTHLRQSRYADNVETFTPKALPKPTIQLRDCITQFTNVERLGAEDPWYCPKCKKHQQATKKFDIWSLPKVLIIHLKRFSFSRSWRDKIDTLVEFPVDNLDMSKYVLNPSQKKDRKLYSLIGVANHYGGLGGGHYTACAKNFLQNQWYTFDDALVTPTTPNSVVTRSAYVLFYKLQEKDD